jgi:predicted transposase/invertase (TIGR01784 family)
MLIEIDPLVDYACKRLLGNPDHPALTLHFLNAVLKPRRSIVNVQIINPIVEKEYEDDKLAIMDILAEDDSGARYNIEIQRVAHRDLPNRLAYYVATQLVEQIGEGDKWNILRPSIGICILDGRFLPADIGFHSDFAMRTPGGYLLTDCLQIHLLELLKYSLPDDNERITDPLEMWLYFFRTAMNSKSDELLNQLASPIFEEAVGVLEMIQRSPDELRLYQARLKAERDAASNVELAYNEGRIEILQQLIPVLQEILGLPVMSQQDLENKSVEDLQKMVADLRKRVLDR